VDSHVQIANFYKAPKIGISIFIYLFTKIGFPTISLFILLDINLNLRKFIFEKSLKGEKVYVKAHIHTIIIIFKLCRTLRL
jgi:hypothetical protein